MWRRHDSTSHTSHHAIRATCTQLLPLVEMFCKYELQEDCSDLRALMLRFDGERALETDELGRAMLQMLRDDEIGFHIYPIPAQLPAAVNPFDEFRVSLAAVDTAIQALQPQVHSALGYIFSCTIPPMLFLPLCAAFCLNTHWTVLNLNKLRFSFIV